MARLLDYYLHTADRADRVLHPFRRRAPVQVSYVPASSPDLDTKEDAARWLDLEWRNILQAARHAGRHEWKQKCADLGHVMADFLEIKAYWDEAIEAHTLALQASRDLADQARIARASLALSAVLQQTGRHEAALPLAEEAAAIYRSLTDRRGEAESLDQMGLVHQRTARSREALAYFREAGILYGAAEDPRGVADTLSHSGIACWHLGRYPEADDSPVARRWRFTVTSATGAARRRRSTIWGECTCTTAIHREALDAYQESLDIFHEIGGTQNEAILHQNIGTVHHYKGSHRGSACGLPAGAGDLPRHR